MLDSQVFNEYLPLILKFLAQDIPIVLTQRAHNGVAEIQNKHDE